MNTFTFMFKEDSFIISQTLKQDVLQYKNEKINCGNPYNGILQGYKEISYYGKTWREIKLLQNERSQC